MQFAALHMSVHGTSRRSAAAHDHGLWPNVIRRLTMPADVEALLLNELERVQ
jgi:hypothetical protein